MAPEVKPAFKKPGARTGLDERCLFEIGLGLRQRAVLRDRQRRGVKGVSQSAGRLGNRFYVSGLHLGPHWGGKQCKTCMRLCRRLRFLRVLSGAVARRASAGKSHRMERLRGSACRANKPELSHIPYLGYHVLEIQDLCERRREERCPGGHQPARPRWS